ncbi:GAF domain-containing protein [Pseudanabaena sp. FACHB-1277]|uniref:GAF domain-containing protein n=1 Tax=Pseudanabaena cinerea FACHB-1277 TaxID=2949581 RepID=A0A926UPU1_9CYAN|nr:adenylate/guanylate cyclase domain-containing protein [Pseudanabaena cinerea]MBD2148844.1 GAF domain-containing protein [Pseudanabaena cinerea FACHB-1277]
MPSVNLKKVLLKSEVFPLLKGLVNTLDLAIAIQNHEGKTLPINLSERLLEPVDSESMHKLSIQINEELLGWIIYDGAIAHAQQIADLIGFVVMREFESKMLANDALDKYREINLLYTIASKMSHCLDVKEIAGLVIDEASRLIRATSASVMLYNPKLHILEIIAARGTALNNPSLVIAPKQGIAGHVFASGKPELLNEASKDPRYITNENESYALICAPICTKDRVLGVVNISNSEPISYTSQDLKLFTALVTQASGAIENAVLHENKLKEERIKNNLERYLSPQVAQAVIGAKGNVSLTTSKRKIAMLFSDIRNFTTKCEELEPEQLVAYLNEYFTEMVDVIFSHQGTVNKFVGDMIVAMFGAPTAITDQEHCAIAAAVSMQRRLKEIANTWIRDNFITGIGISSGDVIVGNIGSPQHMDYTAIGDEMNIASRLQGMAKGGQILVTRSVYEAAIASFEFRDFGTLPVKGKKNLVEVFEVIY